MLACIAVTHAAAPNTASIGEKVDKADQKAEKAVTDSRIKTKVKTENLANSAPNAFKVQVKTKSGMMSLKGQLPNQDAVGIVKLITEKVKIVRSVNASDLTVAG